MPRRDDRADIWRKPRQRRLGIAFAPEPVQARALFDFLADQAHALGKHQHIIVRQARRPLSPNCGSPCDGIAGVDKAPDRLFRAQRGHAKAKPCRPPQNFPQPGAGRWFGG